MLRLPIALSAFMMLASSTCASFAEEAKPFTDAADVKLVELLAPPPANDSDETRSELGVVLTMQVTRTAAMEKAAIADAQEDVWRFADVVSDPAFSKEKLPKFSAFFDRIVATEAAVVDPAKKTWMRPRPHLYSDLVKPIVELSKSGAYPSGHATLGTLMGIVLSEMIPEKRAAIMARAKDYAHNRLVAGIHFPSDIEAGRIAGTVIAEAIGTHEDFRTEFEAARAELRDALKLPKP